MKRKRLLATLLALLFSFSCLSSASAEVLVYNDNTFVNLLNENNVTINGAATNMTAFEISGFLKTFSNDNIKMKYNKILANKNNQINVEPEQMLELIYYSSDPAEQKDFLNRISNKEIQINKYNGIILLSYNNSTHDNVIPNSTTYTISSSRTAEIKMQDGISGTWGRLVMTLTGYFTRTIYDNYWVVSPTDYDLDWTEYSPVSSSGSNTYFSSSASGTSMQPYIGNEVWYKTDMNVFCYPNLSALHIVVYPSSSYNYAYIG